MGVDFQNAMETDSVHYDSNNNIIIRSNNNQKIKTNSLVNTDSNAMNIEEE